MVGWVGLVIPHLARMIVGPDYRVLLPASLLLGGTYMLLVDDLARSIYATEIPLGILTSLVGAPFFLYLLMRSRRGLGVRLEIERASCGYGGKPVVDDVSLALDSGDVLCLLGANGSGKTTLFKAILGLLRLNDGRILVDGADIASWPQRRLARTLAYVPQAHTPPFPFAVRDVVLMARTAHLGLFGSPSRRDAVIAEEAMDTLGVTHLAHARYTEISGGRAATGPDRAGTGAAIGLSDHGRADVESRFRKSGTGAAPG